MSVSTHRTFVIRADIASRSTHAMTVTLPFVFCRLAAITVLWLALIPCIGAQTPPGGDAFLTRFRATVANPDVAALTDLTNLPFLFEGRPHERAAFALCRVRCHASRSIE